MHDHPAAPDAAVAPAPAALAYAPVTDAVSDPERIQAIDVARGFALLGIFLINMQFFSEPFGRMAGEPGPLPGSSRLDILAYYFVMIFCAGKFYPLFSALFGIGFMIQLERARSAGRAFVPAYLRRIGVLMLLGLIHGLLLWYGDILFVYSFAALVLFLALLVFPNASGRSLIVTGIVLALVGIFLGVAINAVLAPETQQPTTSGAGAAAGDPATLPATASTAPATAPATAPSTAPVKPLVTAESRDGTPAELLFRAFGNQRIQGPNDPVWMEMETRAYRDGPYLQALIFRSMTFGLFFIFTLFGFGWHVVGMFFIGAGLMRAGAFSTANLHWHRRMLVLGLVGLLIVLFGVNRMHSGEGRAAMMLGNVLNMLGGPLMSLAYLGSATLIVAGGYVVPLTRLIARAGRMALSNYLSETIIATFLMYHWGLAWFGSVSHGEQVGIAVAIYAGLLLWSTIWLRFFLFGPMEWIWRTLTYLRPQPLVRRTQG